MAQEKISDLTRQTLSVQNKGSISIVITASGNDQHFSFEQDDYNSETMAVAHAEAVGSTQEAKNEYKLSIESEIISLRNNDKPASIVDNGPGSSFSFANELEEKSSDALTIFNNTSESGPLTIGIIKGKANRSSDNQRDYMTLLNDVNSFGEDSELSLAIDQVAEDNNRFFNNNHYLKPETKEGDSSSIGDVVVQNDFGTHGPRKFPNVIEANIIKAKTLKNLGTQIILKAAGEHYIPEDTNDIKESLKAKAASLAPGTARLGLRVPMSSMRAGTILNEINPEYSKPTNPDLSDDNILSHGSYNNPLAPFDAIDSRSSAAAAALLVTTIVGMFEILSRTFNPKNGLQSPIAGSIFNVINKAVITTENDYSECVREGLKIYFGLGSSNAFSSLVGSGFGKFNDEPGYYNTILRNLTKTISEEISSNIFAFALPAGFTGNVGPFPSTSNTIDRNPGVSSDVTNILNSLRRTLNSRVVGFMNVMANMGDLSLSLKNKGFINEDGSLSDALGEIRYNDLTEEKSKINPAGLILRNYLGSDAARIIGSHGKGVSWASNTTPSMYILPKSIPRAADTLNGVGDRQKIHTKFRKSKGFQEPDNTNRLSINLVDSIEKELDASYCPFYFHDLRTNEIISFHAFLTQLSDDFSVDYQKQDGYGRVDSVMQYSKTTRGIGFTFRVVATNPTDFDDLWWKVNKLTTMLYPQYTQGRTVGTGNEKFIQPFSQLIGASPMIRLRIGDVIKSNYSKFNLARLFGLGAGSDSFHLTSNPFQSGSSGDDAYFAKLREVRNRMVNNIFFADEKFKIHHVDNPSMRNSGFKSNFAYLELLPNDPSFLSSTPTSRATSESSSNNQIRRVRPASLITGEYVVQIVSILDDNEEYKTYKVKLPETQDANREYMLTLPTLNSNKNLKTRSTNIYLISDEIARIAQTNQESEVSEEERAATQAFFNSEQNPIFQAFNSNKGKGLAGFITSMNFSWIQQDEVWSLEMFDGKAPRMFEINVRFEPIHDISPGIDFNGFTTAPIYPVGETSNALNTTVYQDSSDHQTNEQNYRKLSNSAQETNRLGSRNPDASSGNGESP